MFKYAALVIAALIATPAIAQEASPVAFQTISGSASGEEWIVKFNANQKTEGWVIQKVMTKVIINGKLIQLKPFWEAFKVKYGYSVDHDTFAANRGANIDYMETYAEAYFYPGLELPAQFQKGLPNCGGAFATREDPKLPTNVAPLVRQYKYKF